MPSSDLPQSRSGITEPTHLVGADRAFCLPSAGSRADRGHGQSPTAEQPRQRCHRRQNFRHIEGRQARRRMKSRGAVVVSARTRRPRPAHGNGRFRLRAPPNRWITTTAPQRPHSIPSSRARSRRRRKRGRNEDASHRPTKVVIPRHLVPQAVRHTQHALANSHVLKPAVDPGARPARRPPATRASARTLQENGTNRSKPQPSHRRRANPPASRTGGSRETPARRTEAGPSPCR